MIPPPAVNRPRRGPAPVRETRVRAALPRRRWRRRDRVRPGGLPMASARRRRPPLSPGRAMAYRDRRLRPRRERALAAGDVVRRSPGRACPRCRRRIGPVWVSPPSAVARLRRGSVPVRETRARRSRFGRLPRPKGSVPGTRRPLWAARRTEVRLPRPVALPPRRKRRVLRLALSALRSAVPLARQAATPPKTPLTTVPVPPLALVTRRPRLRPRGLRGPAPSRAVRSRIGRLRILVRFGIRVPRTTTPPSWTVRGRTTPSTTGFSASR